MPDRKTLILTGASRGIGHAAVKRFSSAGWRVITCSRHPFPEDCPWEMGPEDHIQIDLSDMEDVRRGVGEMKQRLEDQGSRLNALVNKPGSAAGWNGPYLKSDVPLDPWKYEYHYKYPGEHGELDIYSYGQDGQAGGEGEDADVGNWK